MSTSLRATLTLVIASLSLTISGCDSDRASATVVTGRTLSMYDFGGGTAVRLPSELREISDLAASPDGRLFAICDEKGVVYEVDPLRGEVLGRISIGDPPVRGDFEGLARVREQFYAITSDGDLYTFEVPASADPLEFDVVNTGLAGYDIEGLGYDADSAGLLIACKEMPSSEHSGYRGIFAWSLLSRTASREPRILVRSSQVEKLLGIRDFRPSGIARHPVTGSWLVLTSQGGSAVLELAGDSISGGARLSSRDLPQPEGIAVLPDGTLIIASEGKQRGSLVRFLPLAEERR